MRTPATPDLLAALERNSRFLRALALSLVGDENAADDLVQETYVAAIDRPPPRATHLRGWLATVARNLAWRTLRGRDRRARRERDAATPEPLPPTDELVMRGEQQRRLVNAVMELAEPYRSTVLLRYFDGLASSEIARRAGEPESTVRARLKRALDQLRARLDAETPGGREAWLRALTLAMPAAPPALLVPALVASCALVVAIGAATWWRATRPSPSEAALAAASNAPRSTNPTAGGEVGPLEPKRDLVAAPAAETPVAASDPEGVSRVVGVVVAADGGRSAGVGVVVTPDAPGAAPIAGQSGPDGRFELHNVPIEAPAHLLATSADGSACACADFQPRAGFTDLGELLLAERVRLHGSVVELDGSPIAAAKVRCETWKLTAACDASGRFAFDAIPAGRCELALDAPGFVFADSNVLELRGTESALTLHARRGVVVEGRVVDPDGEPIAGARVEVPSESRSLQEHRPELVTDEDGHFAATLPNSQRWSVSAVRPGFTRVDLDLAADQRSIEIVLQPTHLWRVEVVDPQASERDEPLTASVYYLQSRDNDTRRLHRLDERGREIVPGRDPSIRTLAPNRFELRVNGTLDFCVGVKSRSWVEQWSAPIHFDARSPAVTESRFELERRTGALVCTVVDADGAPVAGARVVLDDEREPESSNYDDWTGRWLDLAREGGRRPPPLAERATDDAGVATLRRLAAGSYRVRARAPGGRASDPIDFHVGEGAGVVDERIVVARGGVIEGRVTDESKRPVGAIEVWVVSSRGDRCVTHSASDGSFRFEALEPGAWDVRAHREREAEWYRTENATIVLNENLGFDISVGDTKSEPPSDHVAATVEVKEGDVAHVELRARPRSGATIEGVLLGDEGSLAGIFVEGWLLDPQRHASGRVRDLRAVTDASGHFRFENVANGRWRIGARGELSADGRISSRAELFGSFIDCRAPEVAPAIEVSVETVSPPPITLRAHVVHLRGEVVDSVSGDPVVGAELSVGDAPGLVHSDSSGRFETIAVSGCDPRCNVHARGYVPMRAAPMVEGEAVRLALRPGGWIRVRPTEATRALATAGDLRVVQFLGAKNGPRNRFGDIDGNPPSAREADGTTWIETIDAEFFAKYAISPGRLPASLVFRSETAEPHEVPLEVEFSDSKVNEFKLE